MQGTQVAEQVVRNSSQAAPSSASVTQATQTSQNASLPSAIDAIIDGMNVDVSSPCEEFTVNLPAGVIRAYGYETSMDRQIAKRGALTVALEELASKIEVTVQAVTDKYSLQTQRGMDEELEKRMISKTRTIVNRTITGYRSVCEKTTQNTATKKFTCYIALEISEENILKPVYNELVQDADLKKALPSFEQFDQTFDEVVKVYDANN
jgi:hypothetical protein